MVANAKFIEDFFGQEAATSEEQFELFASAKL